MASSNSFISLYFCFYFFFVCSWSAIKGCSPYLKTLNFYNVENDEYMDGKWFYDQDNDFYRLNISGSKYYYYLQLSEQAHWTIYRSSSSAKTLTYCDKEDLSECAGNWIFFDHDKDIWIFDAEATSQFFDCSYTECDIAGDDMNTNCRSLSIPALFLMLCIQNVI